MVELSIIIPAYNEEERIKRTLELYNFFLKQRFKNYEIIVVCNGCTDKTPEIVRNFHNRKIKLLVIEEKIGKGGAIKEGFKIAKGEIIGYLDADGSTYPESVLNLIENIKIYDAVIGSRWLKDSILLKKQSLTRRFLSRIFNLFIRIFFDLNFTDTQCGAKFFKKKVIDNISSELTLTDWSFDVELLVKIKTKGYKIKEIPIKWSDDKNSRLNLLKAPIKMFISIIGLRLKFDKNLRKILNSRLINWFYLMVKRL